MRQHFTVFDLPGPLAEHILASSPKGTKPFTAKEMRTYLKRKLADPKKRERRASANGHSNPRPLFSLRPEPPCHLQRPLLAAADRC